MDLVYELRRLAAENEKVLATHIALREELAASKHKAMEIEHEKVLAIAKVNELQSELDDVKMSVGEISKCKQELMIHAQDLVRELQREIRKSAALRRKNYQLRKKIQSVE